MPSKHTAAVIAISTAILFSTPGCRNSDRNIPFPEEESEFTQPVSRPFKFSEPEEIKWTVTDPDSIKPLPEKRFDFNKLPSKPFDIGEPYPLLKPMGEQHFALDSLPDTAFNLNALPTQKFKFKTRLTGVPKIIKAGFPTVKQGTSRGIMDVGIDMGLKGNGKCFLQDQDGQLWIGSDKGLWRYDGENWEVYTAAQGLTDENITAITRDKQDQIWIGTNTGQVFVLDREAGLIKQLVDTFQRGNIYRMMEDKEGQIWILRNFSAVFIINAKNETIKQFGTKEGLLDRFLVGMLQDRQGLIWITTGLGVHIIDLKIGTNKRLQEENGLSGKTAISLLQDNRDRIWIGGTGGINIIDLKKATISHLWNDQGIDSTSPIPGLLQDRDGKIWMGKENGTVYSFDEKLGLLEKFHVADGPGNIIYNLLEDKKGQIWMGTITGGCYFINPLQGRFGNFTETEGLGSNGVWSILEDSNGHIWIGTVAGIDVYDPSSKTIKHIGKEQGLLDERTTVLYQDSRGQIWASGNGSGISIIDFKKGIIKHLARAQVLSKNYAGSLLEDNYGQMWIGGIGEVSIINPGEKLVKKLSNAPELKKAFVLTLRKDSKGQLWIGSNGDGIYVTDPAGKTIKYLSTAQGLISNDVTTLMEDAAGNMWIGTQKGIDVADLKNNTLTSFTTNEGLAADGSWTLNEREGNIYVGTSNGLTVLTPTAKENQQQPVWKAASYGKEQGLTSLDFDENGSLLTKKGQLWAGVNEEILTVVNEIKTDTITTPSYITGINILDQQQFFSNRSVTERLLTGIDTLWKTEKDSFYANKQLPIDSGYLQKNKITWDSVEGPYRMPVNLQLPYNQNYLSFNFSGTHISNPDKATYRYILEGIDKTWSPITEKIFSENYRDLPPGNYTFKVSSKGMNNLWSEPAAFSFTILPPWWQTWWAYSLYVLILISCVALFIRHRSQTLRSENRILEEKVARRTAQLNESLEGLKATQKQLIQSEKMASLGELTAGIAHEIQNPLNFVNNFSEINRELIAEMKQEIDKGNMEEVKTISDSIEENEQKIMHHGKRADAIVKGMLQHSRTNTGQKELTDINALADEYLRLSYHGLRAKDKTFNADMQTDFDKTIEKTNIVPQDIGRVLLNLYNNAFYAVSEQNKKMNGNYKPTVSVSTKKVNDKIEIKVNDNGSGIPQKVLDKIFQPFFSTKPTGEGTGLGLSLSYDIIKAHGGEIKVETKEGEGSEFVILLPV